MNSDSFDVPTLVHLLGARIRQNPDKLAFAYLPDGETVSEQWTYAELGERATAVARWLDGHAARGERVLLLHENALHFIAGLFGCALAGAIAVPAYSPVGRKQVARIGKIVNDSGAMFALCSEEALSDTRTAIESFELDRPPRWCASDALPFADGAEADERALPEPGDIALIQYTSGSTSDPKGVVLAHRNFLDNVESIRCALGAPAFDEDLFGVFWLPLHHDMGLVGAVLTTLYVGGSSELMSPASFVLRPLRWLQRISGRRNVITTAPNFAHELCVTTTTPEERAALDLSGWRTALCGAEFVRVETMQRFAEAFAPAGFDPEIAQPVYGLAEGTLLVTGSARPGGPLVRHVSRAALQQRRVDPAEAAAGGSTVLVGCGRPQNDLRLVVVDPDTRQPADANRIGEVWIAGASVAEGYWLNEAATEATFHAELRDPGAHPAGPYLRTGDLGFVDDGELFVVGRLKDLIILRGRNLYPDDLEGTFQEADPILLRGRGAAVAVDGPDGEQLVLVQEIEREIPAGTDLTAVCARMATVVAEEYQAAVAAVVLVRAYSLPSTSSGKVQRYACRQKFADGTLKEQARWSPLVSATPAAAGPAAGPVPHEVAAWLVDRLAAELSVARDDIDIRQPLSYYGLDSVRAVKLADAIGRQYGIEVAPTLAYEYPTISELAEHIRQLCGGGADLRREPAAREIAPDEPIAIVGMACRFPGAPDPEAFWELLRTGTDAVSAVPADRWTRDDVRWGGFLDDVRGFDAEFFGISPREAEHIDPQQRLVLELAWEGLQDAGIVPAELAGQPVGVFLGVSTNDYGRLFYSTEDRIDAYTGTGNASSVAANRISYFFDFRGPSVAIDTACSSSLVALHTACASLRSGESTVALAGGVNLILSPALSINMAKAGVMAADGRCKTFDASADGYVRSEGAGVLILEPLSRAVAAGHPIYSVVLGSASNQDGRTNGLMAPNRRAQAALLRDAYAAAGVSAGDIGYVEAHGTGTLLGDAIEAGALAEVFGENPRPAACAVGSVKSNIGHLEAAAGVAGVIKVALALHHRAIPPTLHYEKPNPAIDLADGPLRIARSLSDWTGDATVAGVSSFGFGGTNAHVVMAAAPRNPLPERVIRTRPALLPISARTPAAVAELAGRYRDHLTRDGAHWPDIAYSAALHRPHHEARSAVVATASDEAAARLAAPGAGPTGRAHPDRPPRVVFVFSGQGGQWLGMGRQLFADEPAFRAAIVRCDREIRRAAGWSVIDELHAGADRSRLDEIAVVQPTLFAIQVALAALWDSWGVRPGAVVGHSMGEVAAAHVAGVLDLADAARVITHRSRLMARLAGAGAMAVIELAPEQLRDRLAESGVAIAAVNGPRSTVVSGAADAIADLVAAVQRAEIFARPIKVDVASHGPHMDAVRPELVAALAGITARTGTIPIFSTVTGDRTDGTHFTAEYWGANLRETVLFGPAIDRITEDGADVFVEISPHPVLAPVLTQSVSGEAAVVLPSGVKDADEATTLLTSLGALYCAGQPIDWRVLYPEDAAFVRTPAYPWQREPHWIGGPGPSGAAQPAAGGSAATGLESAVHPGTAFRQYELSLRSMAFLGDHRVQSAATLPAALHVAVALAALGDRYGGQEHELVDVSFDRALVLGEDSAHTLQMVMTETPGGPASFRTLASSPADWEPLLHGGFRAGATTASAAPLPDPVAAIGAGTERIEGEELYRRLGAAGLDYGPAFRRVDHVLRHPDGRALARLSGTPVPVAGLPSVPGVTVQLDAAFQTLAAAVADAEFAAGNLFLPVGFESLRVLGDIATARWCFVADGVRPGAGPETLAGDLLILGEDGRILAECTGLTVRRLSDAAPDALPRNWFHELSWQKSAPAAPPARTDGRWIVVGGETADAVAGQLAAHGRSVSVTGECPAGADPIDAVEAIVYLAEVDGDDPVAAAEAAAWQLLRLVQTLARQDRPPRCYLVTRGAQSVTGTEDLAANAAFAAVLWGMSRSLEHEIPELRCTRIDLGSATDDRELTALGRELCSDDAETEVALRGGHRFVARVRPAPEPAPGRRPAQPGEGFAVRQHTPGLLEDLELGQTERGVPGDTEVEIEVLAAGVNFHDVAVAIGIIPPEDDERILLGGECAGRVTAVGSGVGHVEVGELVAAIASPAFGSYVTTDAALVVPLPASVSPTAAATVPIAYLTAHHALIELAGVRAGERVLVHAATGGVGLAAIALARRAGAEIFATAGSPEKREYLRRMGIRHVMDSRTLDFADEILRRTGGEGVDVVLNSLSGEAMTRSLRVLRPFGRFVEIGKRDVVEHNTVGLWQLRRNISHFTVDIAAYVVQRPVPAGDALATIMASIGAGELAALPVTEFPMSRAEAAFRFMAQARHIGKVVLVAEEAPEIRTTAPRLRADAQYLVTGGLGALGLATADRLVRRGARHLVLAGRRGPDTRAREALTRWRAAGVEVTVSATDIGRRDQVEAMMAGIAGRGLPLRGVVHAAGTLADATFDRQDRHSLAEVLGPKVAGAWHLHAATRDLPLDFMIYFSSAAGVLGSPGQSNYAGANAFLDSFARYRRRLGLPAASIAWGPWGDIGLASADHRRTHVGDLGLRPIPTEAGMTILDRLMVADPAHPVILGLEPAAAALLAHLPRCAELYPGAARDDRSRAGSAVAEAVAAAAPGERRAILADHLAGVVATRLGMTAADLDREQPLRFMGLDSIGAMELRTRIERDLPVTLPVLKLLEGPSVADLAAWLADRLDLGTPAAPEPVPPAAPDDRIDDERAAALLADLPELSDQAVEDLLSELLSAEGEA
ncbi:type I polyketide synthase [Nocardia sp. BMG111209]|uniref:type I polyketide synthase n=1 Tax=Nocardia sp. BMG111209 TaxID=1160137 RepID=UPI0003A89E3C|nr:type I polyketide synthase [Nocardia sp. BMG111209]